MNLLEKWLAWSTWASYRMGRQSTNGIPHHIGLGLLLGGLAPGLLINLVVLDATGTELIWRILGGIGALVAVLLGLSCLVPIFFRFMPFRRERSVTIPGQHSASTETPVDFRASGVFVLDAKTRGRFPESPGTLVWSDRGEAAVVVHMDASSYFMGSLSEARRGLWVLALGRLCDSVVEEGTLLFHKPRPALRIKTPGGGWAILSADTPELRDQLRRDLSYTPPTPEEKPE
jgi:hypothetical protein